MKLRSDFDILSSCDHMAPEPRESLVEESTSFWSFMINKLKKVTIAFYLQCQAV